MRASAAASIGPDPLIGEIRRRVIERTGLACYTEREDVLTAKIEARMRAAGVNRSSDYLSLLDSRGGEWNALIDEITIGETFFFRYPSQWEALRDRIIPDCMTRAGREPLRVLCAGCANGAEPYTLSMMAGKNAGLSIIGMDISDSRIEQARAGAYGAWDLRATPEQFRACFEPMGAGWRLREEYRRGVEFKVINLVSDATMLAARHAGEFDIVLCRNVMIYFSPETNRQMLQTFHACLKEGGWFVTGHAEPYLEISNVFRPHPIDGAMFYRKQAALRDAVLPAAPPPPSDAKAFPLRIAKRAQPRVAVSPAIRPVHRIEGGIDVARRLANSGHWREAMANCESLAGADPFNPEIQFLIALVADHIGDGRTVEDALKRAIYLDADFALAHYHLALAVAAKGDNPGAARSLRNVFKCLGDAVDGAPVDFGDGLSAGDLRKLAHMQLGLIEGAA